MQGKLTVASLIAGIGAIVAFFFSFLDIIGPSNAWNRQGPSIAMTIPPLAALGLIVLIVLGLTGTLAGTAKVATFTIDQLKVVISMFAALLMVFFLIADTGFYGGWEAGFWLMLLGSLAMAVGTILPLFGIATQAVGANGGGQQGPPQQPQAPPYPQQQPHGGQQQPGAAPPPPPQQPGGGAPPPPPPGGGTPPPPPPA